MMPDALVHEGLLLDTLLQSATQPDITIPAGWGQGRAVFGGLIGGLMVAHAQNLLNDEHKTLRSAFISFIGPVNAGAATLNARILREGKSVTSIQVQLTQDGQVQSMLVASFGSARDSIIAVAGEHTAPMFKAPEQCQPLPFIPGITPEFFQHFDAVWATGQLPFTAAKQPDFGGWFRLKASEQISTITLPHLLVLGDMWPPAVLPMYNRVAPASSLSWNLDLIQLPQDIAGDAWFQYDVKTEFAANGYGYTQAKIWNDAGQLIALSRQTVTVFL